MQSEPSTRLEKVADSLVASSPAAAPPTSMALTGKLALVTGASSGARTRCDRLLHRSDRQKMQARGPPARSCTAERRPAQLAGIGLAIAKMFVREGAQVSRRGPPSRARHARDRRNTAGRRAAVRSARPAATRRHCRPWQPRLAASTRWATSRLPAPVSASSRRPSRSSAASRRS
eukprot:SAG11_NODE_241_length_11781_cov_8.401900_1_plen_175_part_00